KPRRHKNTKKKKYDHFLRRYNRVMHDRLFGEPSPDLAPGARNAVDVCLSIQPGERVALIADEPSSAVAASLAAALEAARAEWTGVLIERTAGRPLKAAPCDVVDALERAEAG